MEQEIKLEEKTNTILIKRKQSIMQLFSRTKSEKFSH